MKSKIQTVEEKVGKFLRAAPHGEVPEAFLAALTANESYPAGNPDSKRHEPAVLAKLVAVCLGQRVSYKGVTAEMLRPDQETGESEQKYAFRLLEQLQDAATSWGLTQIMGYHMLRWGERIRDLTDPAKHYGFTLRLLLECPEDCRQKYGIDVDLLKDFEKMARWWNTGNPRGKTYHASYVPNIKSRMVEWIEVSNK